MRKKLIIYVLLSILFSFYSEAQEVYVPTSQGGINSLQRAAIVGSKTSGKSSLASSLYGVKQYTTVQLDGKYSNNILPAQSTAFYIFKPPHIPIQAFKFVPLKVKKKNRELLYMETDVYFIKKPKIGEIQLMSEKITDELYILHPTGNLESGEYALCMIDNGVPALVYDVRVIDNLPPYPNISQDILMDEFYPQTHNEDNTTTTDLSTPILRWYFDSDPRGARIFYRVISNIPNEVKNTNESYMTTTPLEETKSLHIPGLTYENSADVVIEIKVTKRGYEEQVKRYNVRQAIDQQEISGFFELVEKQ